MKKRLFSAVALPVAWLMTVGRRRVVGKGVAPDDMKGGARLFEAL